jgi:hypothetical protein
MGQLVYILGRSGTGKSYSLRNFEPNELAVVNIEGKILPFRGSAKIHTVNTDDADEVESKLEELAKKYKRIVVDDFQYLMANEFMRRSAEKGYDKFTEIAKHAWSIANMVRDLPQDVIVYILCHTDTDADGNERLKTIGKLLDEKIVLEGMSTIVLKTNVSDGKYTFLTQNNGKDTTKSPADMFPSYAIDNDLKYVDDKIRSYYGFEGAKTDEEMAEADAEVKTEIKKPEGRRRRGSTAEAPAQEEAPAERVGRRAKAHEEQAERMTKALAEDLKEDPREEVPFDEAPEHTYAAEPEEKFMIIPDEVVSEEPAVEENKPKVRRRKVRE